MIFCLEYSLVKQMLVANRKQAKLDFHFFVEISFLRSNSPDKTELK